jgi:uncharacterized protein
VQLLVGPRQVGKTTLLLQLAKESPLPTTYATADAPEALLPGWADAVWQRAEAAAARGPAVLFLDEVQALPRWSAWLKAGIDRLHRTRLPLHVVATGSSALRLGAGTRETMAGRFERLVLGHWRAYLRDSLLEPAIGRDLLQLEAVRKPALLRQLFALAAAHPAEILSLDKMAGALAEKGALETLAHYLELLDEAFLLRPLQKYAGSELRRRRSPPKLVLRSNALLAAAQAEPPPAPATQPARWGRWLENACLAHALACGQEVHYWREEPWEVDGVITGSWGRWLVEVKSGPYAGIDLRGLAAATQRFPDFRPLVICDDAHTAPAESAGYTAIPWRTFLLRGSAGAPEGR